MPEAVITGKDVAEAAVADFAAFFAPGWTVEIPVRFGPVAFPWVKRQSGVDRIVIPQDMAGQVVDSPELLIFHLLMIGHEIAHVVHKHLDGADEQSVEDYHSLELWADFYGAKVMMTLLTFGPRLSEIALRFFPERKTEEALEVIGNAVGYLVSSVYQNHKRYPKKLVRVAATSNGVTSFMRNLRGKDFQLILYYSIFKRVFSSPAVRELRLLDPKSIEGAEEPIKRAADWHRAKQAGAMAITPGLHPRIALFLHTHYDQTEAELLDGQKERREEINALLQMRSEHPDPDLPPLA